MALVRYYLRLQTPYYVPCAKRHHVYSGPGYLEDGAVRIWIDGRLVFERTAMVMRFLPLHAAAADPSKLRPVRQLGHRDLWFNWFHGGKTYNPIDRTLFLTGLVWGREYIGPMKLA